MLPASSDILMRVDFLPRAPDTPGDFRPESYPGGIQYGRFSQPFREEPENGPHPVYGQPNHGGCAREAAPQQSDHGMAQTPSTAGEARFLLPRKWGSYFCGRLLLARLSPVLCEAGFQHRFLGPQACGQSGQRQAGWEGAEVHGLPRDPNLRA